MHQKRNAYLIGANGPKKQHNVTPLKYAEKDIGRLQKALSTYPCEFTNVEGIIASTPFAVLPGLERLANACKRGDLLMVHFAGHAFPWGGHLYLICNQTDVDQKLFTSTAIDINAVKNILNQCHAKHKLLVLDCCHAGTAHGGGTWRGEQELEYALEDLKGSASIILSACAPHKRTRELDTLELDNEYGAGFLSWALASAFTRDFDSIVDDQALSFTDLWKWLPEALSEVNKDLKINEQIPTPLIFREEESGSDNEIWFTTSRRDSIRANTSDERLHEEELKFFEQEEFLQQCCSNASLEGFDKDKVMEYAQKQRDYNQLSIGNIKELCKQLGLTSSLGTPRRSAILLFHRIPNRYLHSALIRIDARAENNGTDVSDKPYIREEIIGPLSEQVEKVLKWIIDKLQTVSENIGAGKRTDRCEIPEKALREIVVNAIVHRDYEASASVRVRIIPRQIMITNPGQLNSAIVNSNPPFAYAHSQARNPFLLDVFIKQGWAEGLSRGFEIIREEFEKYGLPLPEIENLPSGLVQVTIQRPDLSILLQGKTDLDLSEHVWNVPYLRNDYFTGREEILALLHARFRANQTTALSQRLAISGLGGVGKTQIAVQYAYQYCDDYQSVLWARAESHEALTSSFAEIAGLLDLPQKDDKDQTITMQAVKHWLQANNGWLLVLDNADEPTIVREFLPTNFNGHILLTTRAQTLGGLAQRIEVNTFTAELGALFLLRRATLIAADGTLELATPEDREVAMQISEELGGLPLALDQAGAYVEEIGCGLSTYLKLFCTRRATMLKLRGENAYDHPEPVATTWSLSFVRMEEKSSAAADLLRFCAFLAPDSIPEEIIIRGASYLGKHLQGVLEDKGLLDKAIGTLKAYSLIHRDAIEKTLSIHRLVQAVLLDAMPDNETRMWAERTVRAVNAVFPDVEFEVWPQCERCLPHAQACADLAEREEIMLAEVARLLNNAGLYLYERGRYSEAEPLLVRALSISKQQLGETHPDTASSLNNLALLYSDQGKYEQAEPLFVRALSIYEQQLGETHPDVATSLNNLAGLYSAQGKYEQAEPLFVRALSIYEQQLGETHPDTASSLNNLANLYKSQGKYEQAEPLFVRALSICEQQLGETHPSTASSLNNLAGLYSAQGKYEQAEPLYRRALQIREQQLGETHPSTASSLNNLAGLYSAQGKYEQVEPLFVRALQIREQQLGETHPDTAQSLNNLAGLYSAQGKYEQAEPLFVRALSIYEQQLGETHPDTAQSLNNLAGLYESQGKYEQAESLFQRAFSIYQQQLGTDHPDMVASFNNLALLCRNLGKDEQAEPLHKHVLSIHKQQLGAYTGNPVFAAIVTALSAGAITDTTKTAITDSYNMLKRLLTMKFGVSSDVVKAIVQLEAKPKSQGRKEMLQEEINAMEAEQDEELLAAAKQVLALVKPQQASMGKYTIQNNASVQGQNIGDHQHITQHFGDLPKA